MKDLALNFHITEACNMHCKFCHSHFGQKKSLSKEEQKQIIKAAASNGFKKINFAGGEPLLIKHLPELINYAKSLGMVTSVITNGSLLNEKFLKVVKNDLDILGISIDSLNTNTNKKLGRCTKKICPDYNFYIEKVELVKSFGILLKVNTVVTKINFKENLANFIIRVNPIRWKIFQMIIIKGINDAMLKPTKQEYTTFLKINKAAKKYMIPEPEEILVNSYLMVEPSGHFFFNENLQYIYSSNILKTQFDKNLKQVKFNYESFIKRNGYYYLKLKAKQ